MRHFLAAALLFLTASSHAIDEPFENVQFKTRDNVVLFALWSKPKAGQPTVVMLHGLAAQKEEWLPLAKSFREAGIGVLAYDARGHGASSTSKDANGAPNEFKFFGEPGPRSTWERMIDDVGAALIYLQEMKVDRDAVVLAGASLGANVVLNYAALSRPVRGVLLLSPGLNYAEIKTEEPITRAAVPVLIVASEVDVYAFNSSKKLSKTGKKVQFWTNVKDGHGAQMFDENLIKRITTWIKALK